MKAIKFILCYFNAVLVVIGAMGIQKYTGFDLRDDRSIAQSIDVIVFGFIILWVASVGVIYVFSQLVYTLVRLFSSGEKKPMDKHNIAALVITILAYVVIYTTNFYVIDEEGERIDASQPERAEQSVEDNTKDGLPIYQ